MNKILRSLPQVMETHVHGHLRGKIFGHVSSCSFCFVSLITHKMMICEDARQKKKRIAFKASRESKEELDNEDMTLLTRKFKYLFNKNSSNTMNMRRNQSKGLGFSVFQM